MYLKPDSNGYAFKYVLIDVWIRETREEKTLVRGYELHDHDKIFKMFIDEELSPLRVPHDCPDWGVMCTGGGFIYMPECKNGKKFLYVYGQSEEFGPAKHS